MMPSPMKPRGSFAMSATSWRLDPKGLTGRETTARLGRELLPIEQVAPAGARPAARRARRGVAPALREQGEVHRGERLELAHHAVAAGLRPGAARAAADRVLAHPERELELER